MHRPAAYSWLAFFWSHFGLTAMIRVVRARTLACWPAPLSIFGSTAVPASSSVERGREQQRWGNGVANKMPLEQRPKGEEISGCRAFRAVGAARAKVPGTKCGSVLGTLGVSRAAGAAGVEQTQRRKAGGKVKSERESREPEDIEPGRPWYEIHISPQCESHASSGKFLLVFLGGNLPPRCAGCSSPAGGPQGQGSGTPGGRAYLT